MVSLDYSTRIIDNSILDMIFNDSTIDLESILTSLSEMNLYIITILLNTPYDTTNLVKWAAISNKLIAADGAANYIYKLNLLNSTNNSEKEIIPDTIIGDFDSITEDTIAYYGTKNVKMIKNSSQDDTDLEKCLLYTQKYLDDNVELHKNKSLRIYILGGLWGRLDHTLSTLSMIHRYTSNFYTMYNGIINVVDNNSIALCCLPGITKYKRSIKFEDSKGCGVIPLLGDTDDVTIEGFKWNLYKDKLSMMGLISTSNEMVESVVTVQTNKTLLFVTSVRPKA